MRPLEFDLALANEVDMEPPLPLCAAILYLARENLTVVICFFMFARCDQRRKRAYTRERARAWNELINSLRACVKLSRTLRARIQRAFPLKKRAQQITSARLKRNMRREPIRQRNKEQR